jgi:hypothetical protein
MKRSILAVFVILAAVVGCNDSSNPVAPGDPSDPSLALYMDQYQGLVEFTGLQIALPIEIVGIIQSSSPSVGLSPEQSDYTLDYNASTKFWIFTYQFCDGSGSDSSCFAIRDSLQLLQLGVASQYPDSVTSLRSFMRVGVSGSTVTAGTSTQNLNYTLLVSDPFRIDIDGSGHVNADLNESRMDTAGTSDCHSVFNLNLDMNHIILDDGTPNCPIGGKLAHSGPTTITCTGASPGSISGTWTATEDYLTQMLTVVGGGKRWVNMLDCHLFDSTLGPRPRTGPLGFGAGSGAGVLISPERWAAAWRVATGR